FRMFPKDFRQLVEGWTKSMAVGAADTNLFVKIMISLWISGALLAAGLLMRTPAVGGGHLLWYGSTYGAFVMQMAWMLRRVGNFPVITALVYPAHIVFFTIIHVRSLILTRFFRSVSWKGRTILNPIPARRQKT
ncbi:MAG: glycosyl transferase family 2, partial [Chitinivibrionales bacterium]